MSSVETVTVLITDLVGSTGLETRIGPGAADELRDAHFALLRGAIDQAGGRETKNTGGEPLDAVGVGWEPLGEGGPSSVLSREAASGVVGGGGVG